MPLNEFRKTSELVNNGDLTHVVGLRNGVTSAQPLALFDQALRLDENVFNVRDGRFGAVGDGAANDTDAIQSAIDLAAITGGTVYIPPGLYLVNLIVPLAVNISGPVDSSALDSISDSRTAKLKPFFTSSPVISVPESTGVSIRNLAIFGPGAYISGSVGLRIARATPGDRGIFSGFSTTLSGILCIGFEAGIFAATYRLTASLCAFRECKYNIFLNNTASGDVEETPGVGGYPSDHITFINCIAGNNMKVNANTYQAAPNRTNFGVYANTVRCLTFVGGDIGACGVGIHAEDCTMSLNCHIEAADILGVNVFSGNVHFVAVSTLNAAGILLGGTGNVSISALFVNGLYAGGPAFIGIKGTGVNLQSDRPIIVKYMETNGDLIGYGMSNGQRLALERSSAQTITRASNQVLVMNTKGLGCDAVESGASGNYDLSTGRWKCVREGWYQFDYYLAFSASFATDLIFPHLVRRVAGTSVSPDRLGEPRTNPVGLMYIRMQEYCIAGSTYELSVFIEGSGTIDLVRGTTPTFGVATTRLIITPIF